MLLPQVLLCDTASSTNQRKSSCSLKILIISRVSACLMSDYPQARKNDDLLSRISFKTASFWARGLRHCCSEVVEVLKHCFPKYGVL